MINILGLLGIHEGDIEHAYDIAKDTLEEWEVDDSDFVNQISERIEECLDVSDMTNSIIDAIMEAALTEIDDAYEDIDTRKDFSTYINGYDTHLSCTDSELVTIFSGLKKSAIDKSQYNELIGPLRNAGILEQDLVDIINNGEFEDFCQVFLNYNDVVVYDSLEELGADESDNGCRDKDEDDETFGAFLVKAYCDGNSTVFYHECRDGSIISGAMD